MAWLGLSWLDLWLFEVTINETSVSERVLCPQHYWKLIFPLGCYGLYRCHKLSEIWLNNFSHFFGQNIIYYATWNWVTEMWENPLKRIICCLIRTNKTNEKKKSLINCVRTLWRLANIFSGHEAETECEITGHIDDRMLWWLIHLFLGSLSISLSRRFFLEIFAEIKNRFWSKKCKQ